MGVNVLARKIQQLSELGIPGPATKVYERLASKLLAKLHELAIKRLGLGKGLHYVLDAGCGPGHLLSKLLTSRDKPTYAVGLDISPAMVELAKRRLLSSEGTGVSDIVAGDATCLPFRDDSFHAIISTGVLHHISEPSKFFRELQRVLKEGSSAHVFEFSPDTPWSEIRETSKMMGVNLLLLKVISSMHGIPRREYVNGYIRQALTGLDCEIHFINLVTEVEIIKRGHRGIEKPPKLICGI